MEDNSYLKDTPQFISPRALGRIEVLKDPNRSGIDELIQKEFTPYTQSAIQTINKIHSFQYMPYECLEKLTEYPNLMCYNGPSESILKKIFVAANTNITNPQIINVNPEKLLHLSKIVDISYQWLVNIFNVNKINTIHLYLLSPDIKKVFPSDKNTVIGANEVNSGENSPSYSDDKIKGIKIFRQEELIKVLIHETIHCGGFEKEFKGSHDKKYKVVGALKINETITETLAEFINCVLYAEKNDKQFDKVIRDEIDHGFMQTAKILNHFGFTSVEDFLSDKKDDKMINQTTAAFEYHVLKSVLLYKYVDFFELIPDPLTRTLENLMNLIDSTMRTDKMYINAINAKIQNIESLQPDEKASFRMSITNIDDDESIPVITLKRKIDDVSMTGGLNHRNYQKHTYISHKNKYKQLILNYKRY